jgi:MSHA biogenesis protein MshO
MRRAPLRKAAGFTLVELVVTLAVAGIVAGFLSMFVASPVASYVDQVRRAALVDAADAAIVRLARDVQRALPNSVRVRRNGGVVVVELLGTVSGARYRSGLPAADAEAVLDLAGPDGAFHVLGGFAGVSLPFESDAHHLAIYNVGTPGADAWALADVITPPGTRIRIEPSGVADEPVVRLTPAFRFAYPSPAQRVFLVDGPVAYLCDPARGRLSRYTGYAVAADPADRDSHAELVAAGASVELVARPVTACELGYTPGARERAGLLTVRLEVAEAGERVALLHQIHVNNAP